MGIRAIQRYEVSCDVCGHTEDLEVRNYSGYHMEFPHHPPGWDYRFRLRDNLTSGYYGDDAHVRELLCKDCAKKHKEVIVP